MINYERIKEELQMITSVVTDDFDYLLFLLLKDNPQEDEDTREDDAKYEDGYYSEEKLSEWFDNL